MILYVLFLITSLETSDLFCSLEQCEQNTHQLDDIISLLGDLNAKVVMLESKNADLEAAILQLNIQNEVLTDNVIEIQDHVGLRKLPPV